MVCSPKKCKGSMINASELDKRVTFQATTQTPDGAGGVTEAWGVIATVWAKIEPIKSYERFIAMQTETHVTHQITCRYNPLITTAKRAVFNSRIFDITGVVNVNEDNVALIITAMEGTF